MNDGNILRSEALMGTVVTMQVAGRGASAQDAAKRNASVERAFRWFRHIEERCTRFEARSELMQLTERVGVAVPASAILFEAVRFALAVAEQTGGAFDPTVGHDMERRGFNREHRSKRAIRTELDARERVSYRDVRLDTERKTITLLRPLILDLGAVAKGMAIDLAAQELRPFANFAINAGGDLYLGGRNPQGEPWSIGIRHPRREGEIFETLRVTDRAVCTSGDYERRTAAEHDGHHILDPRAGASPRSVASATVIAPTAMLADALATAAFVLGPAEGLRLCERMGVDAVMITPALERFATQAMDPTPHPTQHPTQQRTSHASA